MSIACSRYKELRIIEMICSLLDSMTSSVNVVGDTAAADDRVEYNCNWTKSGISPSVSWSNVGGGLPRTHVSLNVDYVRAYLSVTARARRDLNPVTCEVYFTSAPSGPSSVDVVHVAQNVPSYRDSHSFAAISVTCRFFS